jgi:hypothetical protein
VFVIGVRYNDQDLHIWEALRLPHIHIIFVNPSAEDAASFMAWTHKAGVNADLLPKGLEDAMTDIVAQVIG